MTGHLKVLRPSKTVLLVIGVAAITLSLNILITTWLSSHHNQQFLSLGTIHTISVEAYGGDIIIKNGVDNVDWGTVYVGTSTNRSVFIRSKSNIPTTLTLEALNWTYTDPNGQKALPPNSTYMTLTWNYTNITIDPDQVIPVTLTLNVSSDTALIDYLITNHVTQFSFDIHIYPT
jgi:hypothetical protein